MFKSHRHHHQCGVYRIFNVSTGNSYIGASSNVAQRVGNHRTNLRNGTHSNKRLQSEYNEFGLDAFRLEILVWCHIHETYEYECRFYEKYQDTAISSRPNDKIRTAPTPKYITTNPQRLKTFWNNVILPEDPETCWGWNGKFRKGYPSCGHTEAKRISYVIHYGAQPGDKVVCHTCNNPICNNPKHLILGTIAENLKARSIDRISPRFRRLTSDIIDDVRHRYNAGEPLKNLEAEVGCRLSPIVRNIAWHDPDYKPIYQRPWAAKQRNAKTTWEVVNNIRILYEKGVKSKELASLFNLSQSHICNIVARRIWNIQHD